jgi:hypothetical protein
MLFHGGPRVPRLAAAAVLACLAGLTATACAAAPGPVAAQATLAADPLAAVSAGKLLSEAAAGLSAAATVRLSGTYAQAAGESSVDFGVARGRGCTATEAMASQGTVKVVLIGTTVYLEGSASFWRATAVANGSGAGQADAVARLLGGRYIKGTPAQFKLKGVAFECGTLTQVLAPVNGTGTVTKGKPGVVDGVPVVPLRRSDGSVIDVTDSSWPEVAEVTQPSDGAGDTNLRLRVRVNAPVTLTAPPRSEVTNLSDLGGAAAPQRPVAA